jgi:1-acyl-sn-glycerol-3-phosphate acyltransferase
MIKFIVYLVIRFLLFFICKVDSQALKEVPEKGPMILVGNHINFLDAPIAATFLYPRQIMSFVKVETFDNPILRFLFKVWGSIPVKRGTADFRAMTQATNVLKEGQFFAIFPEGTRTSNGSLIKGRSGIVVIALKSNVPILPIVLYGTEHFNKNFKRFRRTRVTFKVGKPFLINPDSPDESKDNRQLITDEIMFQLAKLLPEENRGYYSDLNKATTHHLIFDRESGKTSDVALSPEIQR